MTNQLLMKLLASGLQLSSDDTYFHISPYRYFLLTLVCFDSIKCPVVSKQVSLKASLFALSKEQKLADNL